MSSEIPFVEIANAIASIINFEDAPGFAWPVKWPHRFRVIEPAIGARLIVEETPDLEIREVPLDHVAQCIVAWLRLQNSPDTLLSFRRAKEVVEMWLCFATPLNPKDIAHVRWKSDPGYTWRRLPWDQGEGPTPTWDKIFSKLTNPDAFRMWLGSLFFDEAKQHQYVWVHGPGNDGKGCINRFLETVFGRAYRSKQPPVPGDKFWTHGLIGARLVVFPDCNSQTFTTGSLFKTLTGGDPVDVEAKGRMSFTTKLQAKYAFFSNEKPNISCEDADMRRIIYCEFFEKTKKEDADPRFEAKLEAEGGYFLSKCVRAYVERCPHHQMIPSSKEEIETWVSVGDERFQDFFDANFMRPHEDYRTHKNLSDLTDEQFDLVTLKPENLTALLQQPYPERRDQMLFRDWIYKKYGVQKKSIRRGDKVVHRYVGCHTKLTTDVHKRLSTELEILRRKWHVVATPATVDAKRW